jgi:hypothetical protein
MNPTHNWIASYNVAADSTIQNCIAYNCHTEDDFATILIKEDPMFVDAANGDFMLYAESPAVGAGTEGSNLGDPRWGVKAGIQPGEGKLKDAVDAAQPGATIVLGDETYEVSSSISCDVEGLTIKAAEGQEVPNRECPVCHRKTLVRKYSPKTKKHFWICQENSCVHPTTLKPIFYADLRMKPVIKLCPICGLPLISVFSKKKKQSYWFCPKCNEFK